MTSTIPHIVGKVHTPETRQAWWVLPFAMLCVFICGLRPPFRFGIQPAMLVAVAMLPVWAPYLAKYRLIRWYAVASVVAVFWGAALAQITASGPVYSINQDAAISIALRVFTAVGAVGVMLWARSLMHIGTVAACFGAGMLVTNAAKIAGSANPWKFELSFPVTLIILGLISRSPRLPLVLGVCGMLAVIGAANDSRSYAGFVALTGAIVLGSRLRQLTGKRWNRMAVACLAIFGAYLAYVIGETLLVDGALGAEAALRTQEQLDQSGNLLIGGRPEWMATFNLAQVHPWGVGMGIMPVQDDVVEASEGLISIGIATYRGYVDNYMMAGQFNLHSIVADLWINLGMAGLVLGLTILWTFLHALVTGVSRNAVTPITGFALLMGCWNMCFGPLFSNMPDVAVCLAIVAVPLATRKRKKPLPNNATPTQNGADLLPSAPSAAATVPQQATPAEATDN